MGGAVAITGLGALSSLGAGVEAHRRALAAGTRRMLPPTVIEVAGADPPPVAEVPPGCVPGPLPAGLERYDSRAARIAIAAAREALEASGAARRHGGRIGLFLGTTSSGIREMEEAWRLYRASGAVSPGWDFANKHLAGSIARAAARALGLEGPVVTATTACSSSAIAMIQAALCISSGRIGAAAVLGIDTLSEMVYYGFRSLGLVSPFPTTPFDAKRKGLTLGEAGACLVLEEKQAALRAGAPLRGELLGFAMTSDAHHITAPDPEGQGIRRCVTAALARAGIGADRVDAVNAHGTGTVQNDAVEGKTLGAIFGPRVPVTSTKSFTGHTLGAAGAIEALFSLLAIEDGFFPPTLGTTDVPAELGVNVVTGGGARGDFRAVLSTSFGFGGSNAALLLGRGEAR